MFLKCHRSGRLYFYLSDRLKNVGSDKRDRFSLFIRTVNTFSEYTWAIREFKNWLMWEYK